MSNAGRRLIAAAKEIRERLTVQLPIAPDVGRVWVSDGGAAIRLASEADPNRDGWEWGRPWVALEEPNGAHLSEDQLAYERDRATRMMARNTGMK